MRVMLLLHVQSPKKGALWEYFYINNPVGGGAVEYQYPGITYSGSWITIGRNKNRWCCGNQYSLKRMLARGFFFMGLLYILAGNIILSYFLAGNTKFVVLLAG